MSYKTTTSTPPVYTSAPPAYAEDHQPLISSSSYAEDIEGVGHNYDNKTVSQSSVIVRMEFVRKVYSILAVQLFATVVVSATMMYNESIKQWAQTNIWALIVSMIGTLILVFALYAYQRSTPLNFYLLGGFTLLESYLVGSVVTFYEKEVVLQALIITFGLFVGLTLFTLQSKWDFSGMGPFLFSSLNILILFMFVQIFLPFNRFLDMAIALIAVIIFSFYIIFDTYLIFNRLSPEDYISAALSLYLDIINLFLRVLQILGTLQRD